MKIYISLPMRGQETTVHSRYESAAKHLKEMFPKAVISGPLNIEDFDDTGYTKSTANGFREHPWEWYIGEDVKELLTCDTIYMCKGWEDSEGCCVELAIAKEREMLIFREETDVSPM